MSKAEMMPEKDFQARARLPATENPVKMTGKLELADAGGSSDFRDKAAQAGLSTVMLIQYLIM